MNTSSRISASFDHFLAHICPSRMQMVEAERQSAFLREHLIERIAADGAFHLEKIFLAGSSARHTNLFCTGQGSIINLSSMAAQIGLAGGAAYGATKAALSAMTRAWAAEFSPSGVRVNAIAPGPVYTDGAASELIETLGNTTALKRAANIEEIAEVASFLVSPQASYATGAIIAIDGGRTAI